MEKQPPLPIKLTRDDNEDKAALVIQVKDNLNELLDSHVIINVESRQNSELSIYKIPHFMREIHPNAFDPQLVSFGPYHHGKPNLVPMELEKLKAFHDFKTNNGLDVESIVKSVSSILDDLLGSYDKLEEEWTEKEGKFLQVMIVDGCFMLQFFKECPISLRKMSAYIVRDMLLLENQLPMKLLDELYSIAKQDQPLSQDLKLLVCKSLGISPNELSVEYSHILDMYKASLLYPPIERTSSGDKYELYDRECQIIPPATQLREAGIKFEKSMTRSYTDVSFDQKRGVLRLPRLVVDDNTESNFLNVMAFETLFSNAESPVTSFIIIMSYLIKEDKDVALLSAERILFNALGTDKAAAEMFSMLTKFTLFQLTSKHAMMTIKMVNMHSWKAWNVWWANLKDPRTQKPWVIISLAAAAFGFMLQITQTVYGVYGYHRPTHS